MKDKKEKELKELVQPLQDWLVKNYNPMTSILIEDGKIIVLLKEKQILTEIKN